MREWLYSRHQSNIWHWHWQVSDCRIEVFVRYWWIDCFFVTLSCKLLLQDGHKWIATHKISAILFFSSIWWCNYYFPFSLITFFHDVCRVNKPYLPIAAGDLSVQSAWFLVLLFAVAGLLIVGMNFGPFITSLYCLGLFLGTIYSVPPFRLKRFAVIAFLIIATVCLFLDVFVCFLLILTAHVAFLNFFRSQVPPWKKQYAWYCAWINCGHRMANLNFP